MGLPAYIENAKKEIQKIARDYGLDFFDTIFEMVDFDQMNEIASYGGFPTRYPHWRFGMEYDEMKKGYAYGLHKIYEMVINNNPCYAYLLRGNKPVDQKLVVAHVYAHCDFFKNNIWFSKTNRKMVDHIANHGIRIRKFIEKYGAQEVEKFIDTCLSLENLIDIHSLFIKRTREQDEQEEDSIKTIAKLKSKDYMDSFINPDDFLNSQRESIEKQKHKKRKFPEAPEKDVLQFLIEHAPLKRWQQEILTIFRDEAYYFAPQGQTKIMNEGWATYWHSKIMTTKVLTDAEVIDYADHHSGTLSSGTTRINPYKLGVELFRNIEDRWNKGKFGKEYEECDDYRKKKKWNKKLGMGREKIFEIRKFYNDVSFIDAFFTEEFCHDQNLFTYHYNQVENQYEIANRDFRAIKQSLLQNLTNFGQPHIFVEDANYINRGELYLKQRHEGVDLKLDEAKQTLRNINKLWDKPVHLETVINEGKTILSFDGEENYERELIE